MKAFNSNIYALVCSDLGVVKMHLMVICILAEIHDYQTCVIQASGSDIVPRPTCQAVGWRQ